MGKNGQGEVVFIGNLVDGGHLPWGGKDTRSPGPGLAPTAQPQLKHEGDQPLTAPLTAVPWVLLAQLG